jgi:hypothetical protein
VLLECRERGRRAAQEGDVVVVASLVPNVGFDEFSVGSAILSEFVTRDRAAARPVE